MHRKELLLTSSSSRLRSRHLPIYLISSTTSLLLACTCSTLDNDRGSILDRGICNDDRFKDWYGVNSDGCRFLGSNRLGLGLLDLLVSLVSRNETDERTTGLDDPMRPKRAASIPIKVKNAAASPAATSGICLQAWRTLKPQRSCSSAGTTT